MHNTCASEEVGTHNGYVVQVDEEILCSVLQPVANFCAHLWCRKDPNIRKKYPAVSWLHMAIRGWVCYHSDPMRVV
jgi:hypothetical protein